MYIVFLRFSDNKANAGAFMEMHKAWLQLGFDKGFFLFAASLQNGTGGSIMTKPIQRKELEDFIHTDPFVHEKIVDVEIVGLKPSKVIPELEFILN